MIINILQLFNKKEKEILIEILKLIILKIENL